MFQYELAKFKVGFQLVLAAHRFCILADQLAQPMLTLDYHLFNDKMVLMNRKDNDSYSTQRTR